MTLHKTKDGGLAFPSQALGRDGLPCMEACSGMTVRQVYKAAALTGVLAHGPGKQPDLTPEQDADVFAYWFGIIADAMIKEDEEHDNSQQGE